MNRKVNLESTSHVEFQQNPHQTKLFTQNKHDDFLHGFFFSFFFPTGVRSLMTTSTTCSARSSIRPATRTEVTKKRTDANSESLTSLMSAKRTANFSAVIPRLPANNPTASRPPKTVNGDPTRPKDRYVQQIIVNKFRLLG